MAKLEEVLPHLRAGGLVKVTTSLNNPELNLDQLLRSYVTEILLDLDFEIVKKPYRRKTTIFVDSNNHNCYSMDGNLLDLKDLFPIVKTKEFGEYRVTIEEIEEKVENNTITWDLGASPIVEGELIDKPKRGNKND